MNAQKPNKRRWSLLWPFLACLDEVIASLELGARKHGEEGWRNDRRLDDRAEAIFRHLSARFGPKEALRDEEGQLHLAAAVVNCLIVMWHDGKNYGNK